MTASPELDDLIARATDADGLPPFSDGALVQFANGERELVWELDADGRRVGAALDSPTESEFVVDPDARGHGHGARMLDMLTHPSRGGGGGKLFWAHGDHPAARALARHHGLEPVRTLLHLRLDGLPESPGAVPAGVQPFAADDADDWLRLNARAFAAHPEQGGVTQADLDVLLAEPWFDAGDFLLLRRDGELVGYVWLKIVANGAGQRNGEFYVVGVDPGHQGQSLGRALMAAGFARLAERGIHSAHLYVEGDNAAALRLYRGLGFTESGVDVQYHYAR
ncbi:mycothiol synthase [soil metagenome]